MRAELFPMVVSCIGQASSLEVVDMTQWHSAAGDHGFQHKDIQHDDDVGYYGGWTLSGLAVLATIGVVWLVGM
jgi:fumarate reductase subunit D